MELGEDGGDDFLVTGLGGADEVVVGEAELAGEGFPLHGEAVAVGLRVLAFGSGGLLDLLSVFVEAGQEEDLVTEAAVGARDDIGQHHLVGVPEVCCAVGVENRRGQVEPFAHEVGTVSMGMRRGNGGGEMTVRSSQFPDARGQMPDACAKRYPGEMAEKITLPGRVAAGISAPPSGCVLLNTQEPRGGAFAPTRTGCNASGVTEGAWVMGRTGWRHPDFRGCGRGRGGRCPRGR